MSFEKQIKKIPQRDWGEISNNFIVHLQEFPNDIGKPPESTVDDLLRNIQSELSVIKGTVVQVKLEVPFIQFTMLRESIYLAHKACALAHSISLDLSSGRATYPAITAYNANLFLTKALFLALGIWFPTVPIDNKFMIVDCMYKNRRDFETNAFFVGFKQLGHKEVWMLLQRVFRVMRGMPFDKEMSSFLTGLDLESFSKNRNQISYLNTTWTYDDLHSQMVNNNWKKPFSVDIYANIYPDDLESHFDYHLMLILFRSYLKLLNELESKSASIHNEFVNIKNKLISYNGLMQVSTWLP